METSETIRQGGFFMHEILSPVILEGLAIPFLGTTLGEA